MAAALPPGASAVAVALLPSGAGFEQAELARIDVSKTMENDRREMKIMMDIPSQKRGVERARTMTRLGMATFGAAAEMVVGNVVGRLPNTSSQNSWK